MPEPKVVVSKPPSLPVHPCGAYRHNSLVFVSIHAPSPLGCHHRHALILVLSSAPAAAHHDAGHGHAELAFGASIGQADIRSVLFDALVATRQGAATQWSNSPLSCVYCHRPCAICQDTASGAAPDSTDSRTHAAQNLPSSCHWQVSDTCFPRQDSVHDSVHSSNTSSSVSSNVNRCCCCIRCATRWHAAVRHR